MTCLIWSHAVSDRRAVGEGSEHDAQDREEADHEKVNYCQCGCGYVCSTGSCERRSSVPRREFYLWNNCDWRGMSLTYDDEGNVIVSDVTFSEAWKETKMGDSGVLKSVPWPMSLTVINKLDMRLPIWIGSTIRLVYKDNLLTVGLSKYDGNGNPDYDMKLLAPGTNRISIDNEASPMVYITELVNVRDIMQELSNPPTYGCLSIGIAVE